MQFFVTKVASLSKVPLTRSFCLSPRCCDARNQFRKNDRDPNWQEMKKCQKGNDCLERADDCNDALKNHSPPYQQAWCDDFELPPKQLYVPRECCVIEPPRRGRKPVKPAAAQSACPMPPPPKPTCGAPPLDRCVKIGLKGCKPARIPTTCVRVTPPILCIPLRTPLPSFHDCIKDPVRPLPPDECHCFDKQPPCTPTPRMLADR